MSEDEIIFSSNDFDRMVKLLLEVKIRIEELERLISEEDQQTPLKYLLLKCIHEEGGVITKTRFNELAIEVGYSDLRGPQGLFAYGGRFITQIAGNRVAITPRGTQRLQERGLI